MSGKGTDKAVKAAKAARTGVSTGKVRVRSKVHFYRPKTLVLARDPKYTRSLPSARGNKFDAYQIIKAVSSNYSWHLQYWLYYYIVPSTPLQSHYSTLHPSTTCQQAIYRSYIRYCNLPLLLSCLLQHFYSLFAAINH